MSTINLMQFVLVAKDISAAVPGYINHCTCAVSFVIGIILIITFFIVTIIDIVNPHYCGQHSHYFS